MTIELARYAIIFGGLFVLGFNLAVIVNAAHIVRAVTAWRTFMAGKSGLTAYVIVTLHDHIHGSLGWRVPFVAAMMALTLLSLVMLDHSYRRRNGGGLPERTP